MKIIETPADLTIKFMKQNGEADPKVAKFPEWAENIIDFYSEAKTLKQVRQVQKIVDALKTSPVRLEDAEYDLLKAAVEAYPTKIVPFIVRQHLPFIDAIEKAQEVAK